MREMMSEADHQAKLSRGKEVQEMLSQECKKVTMAKKLPDFDIIFRIPTKEERDDYDYYMKYTYERSSERHRERPPPYCLGCLRKRSRALFKSQKLQPPTNKKSED